jgi:hypothetical protein
MTWTNISSSSFIGFHVFLSALFLSLKPNINIGAPDQAKEDSSLILQLFLRIDYLGFN